MFGHLSAAFALFPRCLAQPSSKTLSGACRLFRGMEPVIVRSLPGEPKLTISLCLNGSHKHMLRDQDEPLGKALARISSSSAKSLTKAKKTKKSRGEQPGEAAEAAVVKLLSGGEVMLETLPNSEAWRDGAVLQVGDVTFSVHRNPPSFTTAELPLSLLSGFPVCPKLEVEFGNLQDSEFTWFKENPTSTR